MALLAFFGIVGVAFMAPLDRPHAPQTASALEAVTPQPHTPFPHVALTARAAYVYDITNDEVLFAYNETTQLPLASLTKVAVMLLADRYLQPNNTILITERSLEPEGSWGFEVNDSWRARELIDYTLMTSSNDGAAALAEAIENASGKDIVTLLNELSGELNLSQTYFLNETGLDVNDMFSGSYGSAQDMAHLFAYAYTHAPYTFEATTDTQETFTSANGLTYTADNTNQVLGSYPGIALSKTGFTDLAGGNLGIVAEVEPGHSVALIVLGSTVDDRFTDVATLLRAVHTRASTNLQN